VDGDSHTNPAQLMEDKQSPAASLLLRGSNGAKLCSCGNGYGEIGGPPAQPDATASAASPVERGACEILVGSPAARESSWME
jgi:hypothetical protein